MCDQTVLKLLPPCSELPAAGMIALRDKGIQNRPTIPPYPQHLEQWIEWQGRTILLRPIRPDDACAHIEFFHALDPEDIRYRMFVRMPELSEAQLKRFTQIDYDREMAFIATRPGSNDGNETLGVVRVVFSNDNVQAEFAVIIRSDLKRRGLGQALMNKLIAYCVARGAKTLVGDALPDNDCLVSLARKLGFARERVPEEGTIRLRLNLPATFIDSASPMARGAISFQPSEN